MRKRLHDCVSSSQFSVHHAAAPLISRNFRLAIKTSNLILLYIPGSKIGRARGPRHVLFLLLVLMMLVVLVLVVEEGIHSGGGALVASLGRRCRCRRRQRRRRGRSCI